VPFKNTFRMTAAVCLALCGLARAGTTYYVDSGSEAGSDPGTRMSAPFKSLAKVNSLTLGPGDRLLFRRGSRYTGQLAPKGRGREGSPIRIGAYGEGARPRFDGEGKVLDTVLISNMEYVEVEGLEVTNHGPERREWQTGFKVQARDCGTLHNVVVRDIYVHDVNGSLDKKKEGCGLYVESTGRTKSRFDGLVIEKCRVVTTDRNGICMRSGFVARTKNWYPSLDVVIRENLIEDCGGDAIKPWGCDGALVEHNTVRGARMRCKDYAAGIWPWSCDDTVIQFNEVSGCKGTKDGQGFDCDYNCKNTLIQYNYSHHNEGGFLLVCGPKPKPDILGTTGSVIRYNVSYADGGTGAWIFHISGGGVKDTLIHNNVIYVKKRAGQKVDNNIVQAGNWGGLARNTVFRNNIFHAEGTVRYALGKDPKQFVFENNRYVGNHQGLPRDAGAVKGDPGFVKLLEGDADGFDVLKAFMLRPDSPCRGAARTLPDHGGRDLFGNRLPAGGPKCIGIHEAR
jgi:hypothetical protein